MTWHKGFRVTGVINSTVFDVGLESSEKEPKKLISILIQVSDYQSNDVEGWIEKTKIFNIPDKLIDTDHGSGSTNMQLSAQRINQIAINVDLSPGEVFKVGIKSGGTATDIVGAYVYEITGA